MEVNPKDGIYTLFIKYASPNMQGEVKAVAKNNGGEVLCSATLQVRGRAPTFLETPLKCTVLEGQDLTMKFYFNIVNILQCDVHCITIHCFRIE